MEECESMESERPLAVPAWLSNGLSLIGELLLLLVTIAIITAMWLPAYLSGRPQAGRLVQPPMDGPMPARPLGSR